MGGGGESSPTCLLCTHNGHICLPFPGANRDIGAAFLFHGAGFLPIPEKPGWHGGKSSPQISAHPSPTTAHLPLPRSGQATHLSFFSLGMALGAGSNLRPGGTKRQWGEDGRRRGPGPAGPSRAPLPLPRGRQQRREPPGPVGKMADGPGVACHPRRRQRPAMPGRNLG